MEKQDITLTKEEYDILFEKVESYEKKHFKDKVNKQRHHRFDETKVLLEALYSGVIEDIETLKSLLAGSYVNDLNGDRLIQTGSKFTVEIDYFGEKEREEYTLVRPSETNSLQNLISYASPLGRAVKAKREGEKFFYQTEHGKVEGTILEIVKEKKI